MQLITYIVYISDQITSLIYPQHLPAVAQLKSSFLHLQISSICFGCLEIFFFHFLSIFHFLSFFKTYIRRLCIACLTTYNAESCIGVGIRFCSLRCLGGLSAFQCIAGLFFFSFQASFFYMSILSVVEIMG